MTTAQKNTILRVIRRRLANGETFDEIINDYPRLTDEEVEMLRETVGA